MGRVNRYMNFGLIFCMLIIGDWRISWATIPAGQAARDPATILRPVPNAQELTQLRDIHLPEAIGWWPLALGWYVLSGLVIMMLFCIILFIRHRYLNGRAKRHALRLLAFYEQQHQHERNNQLSSARVSELLKRVALAYFPRTQVASLQGDAWIVFLNHTAKEVDFTQVRSELLEFPYHPNGSSDRLPLLFSLTKTWIKQRRGRCLN